MRRKRGSMRTGKSYTPEYKAKIAITFEPVDIPYGNTTIHALGFVEGRS
jgi:hypothetical protein